MPSGFRDASSILSACIHEDRELVSCSYLRGSARLAGTYLTPALIHMNFKSD